MLNNNQSHALCYWMDDTPTGKDGAGATYVLESQVRSHRKSAKDGKVS
jgi:hypothetical protein